MFKVSEERIPWEEEKETILRRERSKSLPTQKINLPELKKLAFEKSTGARAKSSGARGMEEIKTVESKPRKNSITSSPQKLILTRGSLKLSVNFPVDTHVTFQSGKHNKLISGVFCQCKRKESNI